MPEQLSQAQIDALLKKMSSGEVAVEEKQTVKEYDFKSPKKFTKEQLKAMDGLHETFSRLLSSYLSGVLRIGCDVQVLQIDEERYYEYNNALPDTALIGIVGMNPEGEDYSEGTMIIDVSTTMGFYLVDRLLGGSGDDFNFTRDYTEIEMAIIRTIFKEIVGKLEDSWKNSVEVKMTLDSIETNSRLLQIFAPEDSVIIVVINIKAGKMNATMSICMPADNMEEIIDKFSMKYSKSNRRIDPAKEQMRKEVLLRGVCDTDLPIKATFDQFKMDLKDILQLQPSDIIPLNKKITDDIQVTLDGLPWFTAKLGETKKKKAIKLNKIIVETRK